MSKLYDEKSIESLSPLEFTRLRPGVYAGDTTYSTQLLVEIFSNAVDEYNAGHGDVIEVTIDKDEVTVEDHGQGFIPNCVREDGKTILEAAFSVLNTSGKYREDGSYDGNSLGSFGIGSKITTFLSHWLVVETHRDKKYEKVVFEEGVFKDRATGPWTKESGTIVTWKPSEEFFTNTEVELSKIKSLFKTVSCLCPGLIINLTVDGKTEKFHSENGLNDLVDDAVGDKEIINNRLIINDAEGKFKFNMVMTYTSNYSGTIIPYVNTGLTDTGAHITQLKTCLTREFNKYLREKKILKDKDENLTGDDIQEGLYVVFNYTAPSVKYDAQVKSRITGIETKFETQSFVEGLTNWLEVNEKDVKLIADKALSARKAREAAKKAREAARQTQVKKKDAFLEFDNKLTDCYSKDREKCEIYIIEGDSAGGNMKQARNREFQAVLPLRGKVLNVEKATLDKIMKNNEIKSMILAFGLQVQGNKLTFKKEDLRYGKIIIMTDADVDGDHISILMLTFLWRFCPELIKQGYVYLGVPPLFRVTINKEYIYLKDDAALAEFKKAHVGKKFQVNRMKGLGEMDVDETEVTLTHPETRFIKQMIVSDDKSVDTIISQLMGENAIYRKQLLKEHGHEARYNQE